MSLHTWRHQGPRNPSSFITFTLNSHWGRAATGKKKSCTCAYRVTSGVSDFCYSVDSGLPGFSVREGGSPGYTRAYWPILVAIPF